jgi:Mrp family chromosome partitioning ATPase
LQARLVPGAGNVILITSAVANEGKSLLALCLGRALALAGRRVLVVEFDLWQPSMRRLARRLPLEPTGQNLARAPIRIDRTSGLAIAAAEPGLRKAERAPALQDLLAALDAARAVYEIVLLDAPPVLDVPDVLPIAAEADGTLLLVRFEGPDGELVRASLDQLAAAGANLLGTVLSRIRARPYRRYGNRVLPYAGTG